ncbi:protein of unknown function (plasmid) [Cupriavidus taiwanensis]|uniref:Uncharacterized protein n=1 Tax=Cupriavidus taiwanensis TaxID=164546 RepID=A0A375HMG8_9BURK|nr:hypothetical protein CBM2592_B150043 [Cupriavidus taiwanensis]SOY67130.1 hypothetical protein CBM2588_B190043 [Cupriavidus taiwanensis]SOZ71706.1 hypothetical protein CBM2617_B180046 [Cupriavidus taiwanensis]SOZ86933.1 hypothetical protein CBM2618_B200046 [Cupriavidus taiwanensis]SOZ89998.1 hypothetical protein CBM2622_B190046 [Cupriavidus taiwanensis]
MYSGRRQRGLSCRDACGGARVVARGRRIHPRDAAMAMRDAVLRMLHGGVSCAMRRDGRPASRTALPPGDAVSGKRSRTVVRFRRLLHRPAGTVKESGLLFRTAK